MRACVVWSSQSTDTLYPAHTTKDRTCDFKSITHTHFNTSSCVVLILRKQTCLYENNFWVSKKKCEKFDSVKFVLKCSSINWNAVSNNALVCVGTHWHTTLRVSYLLGSVVRPVVPLLSCFCLVVCLYWVPAEMWREREREAYLKVANVTACDEILLAARCPGIINQ